MECKVEKFQSPGKGNGLWSTSTVPPGELLYVAEPFAYTVNLKGRGLVCENCLCSPDHLLQCSRCKFVKYCSKSCQTEAWPDHKSECRCLMSVPFKENCDPIRLVGKMILKMLQQTSPCPSEELYSVSEMYSNYENVSEDFKMFQLFSEMLQSYLKVEIPQGSRVLSDFNLPEYFAKVTCNHFSISNEDMVDVAVGLYPSMSLLNHSCEPNCAVVFKGRQLHLRAIKKIHIGDELTRTYVPPMFPTEDRQAELWGKYFFGCDCRRCLTRDKDEDMLVGDKQASYETKELAYKVIELSKQDKWEEECLSLCRAQLKRNVGRVPDKNFYQLTVLHYAMTACMGLKMTKEALQYGSRTLEPYRLYTSEFSPYRALPMFKVGTLQVHHRKYAEALKTMNEVFDIVKISYGMDHPLTQKVIDIIQLCRTQQYLHI